MPDNTATIHELDAIRAAARSASTIGEAVDTIMAELNSRFMVVLEHGKAVVLEPGFDPILKRRKYERLSTRDLQTLYLNRSIKVGEDEKNRPIWKSAADVWLRHRDRRQFINGVVFDPTRKHAGEGILNLWEGFAVQPAEGDWSLLREHIRTVICGGDPIRFGYLMGWMARMLQQPAEMGEVAVVMKGSEGCGKGTLAKALKRIIGQHALAVSNAKHLVGNFNAHLRDCIFLFADEAFFAGDRAHVGVLKAIVTEPTLTIEAKFANSIEAPNMLHIMMASNEQWVVPASMESRRFFVLEVSDARKNDHDYFAAIWQQMETGGYAAMLGDLLNEDLSNFNVRSVPTTDGLQRQRKLSLGTTEAWWLDCLERGYVFQSRLGLDAVVSTWMPSISTQLLMLSYLEFAKVRGERRPLSREGLGEYFSATLRAKPVRLRNAIAGEAMMDMDNPYGGTTRKSQPIKHPRPPGYFVGELEVARANFVKHTGLPIQWDGGAPNDDLQPPAAAPCDVLVCSSKADDPFGDMTIH